MSNNRFDDEILKILDSLKNNKFSFEDVKEFLGYEDEFWKFLDSRKKIIIDHYDCDNLDDNIIFYGVFTKPDYDTLINNGGVVEDFRFIVPKVVDIKTAIICVHELKHCYDFYKLIGCPIDKSLDE